jgi:hypothetical protein
MNLAKLVVVVGQGSQVGVFGLSSHILRTGIIQEDVMHQSRPMNLAKLVDLPHKRSALILGSREKFFHVAPLRFDNFNERKGLRSRVSDPSNRSGATWKNFSLLPRMSVPG